jgi:hypothetical protein
MVPSTSGANGNLEALEEEPEEAEGGHHVEVGKAVPLREGADEAEHHHERGDDRLGASSTLHSGLMAK